MKLYLLSLKFRIRKWLIYKLGGVLPEPEAYSYRITNVYKTGETRPIDVKMWPKPLGWNLYGDDILIKFLPLKGKS